MCRRACVGVLPRHVGERHPRLPHERHHVLGLRALAAVLPELLGGTSVAAATLLVVGLAEIPVELAIGR